MMFDDRTKAHADHVGHGIDRRTCAAVGMRIIKHKWFFRLYGSSVNSTVLLHISLGVLKAVHCSQSYTQNRITKDVVAFHAEDFPALVEKLQLDLHEPPISQVCPLSCTS
jgi:hypothetical protein